MKRIVFCIGSSDSLNAAIKEFIETSRNVFDVVVIHELTLTPKRTSIVLRSLFKKKGLIYLIDYILLKAFFTLKNRSNPSAVEFHHVTKDLNLPKSIEEINSLLADYIICIGTGYLHKNTISSIKAPLMNLHCGINPRFRGNGSIWAVKENQWALIGLTLHQMTNVIDSGNIFFRIRAPLNLFKDSTIFDFEDRLFKFGLTQTFNFLTNKTIVDDFKDITLENKYYPYISLTNWLQAKKNYIKKFKSPSSSEDL